MRRRRALAFAGWLATAVLATLVGVAAIRLVGESITGTPGGVHSQRDVERALASPQASTAAPGGSPSTGPGAPPATASPGAGARRAFATAGGSAVAECTWGGVRLVSWAPAQGYRVGDADQGPDDDVEVTFVGSGGEHELKLRCVAGEPVAVADD